MKKARERLGLSQYEMAERLGVSQATVSGWENGDHGPEPYRMRDVAAAYQLKTLDLIPEAG